MQNLRSLVVLCVLAASAAAAGRDSTALIELDHEIVGPRVEHASIRLEQNGRIIHEKSRWAVSHIRRCKIDKAARQAVSERAAQLVDALPTSVNSDAFVRLDGPSKTIRVLRDGHVLHRIWYSPDTTHPSPAEQQFESVWQTIAESLECQP